MFTETDIIAVSVLGFGLGIALTITASFVKQKIIEEVEIPSKTSINLEKRISPFIDIHQSLMEDPESSAQSESVNRLKNKIESFKNRNKFYQS